MVWLTYFLHWLIKYRASDSYHPKIAVLSVPQFGHSESHGINGIELNFMLEEIWKHQ